MPPRNQQFNVNAGKRGMTRKEQEQQQKREEASKAAGQRERQAGPLDLPVIVPKGPIISKKALLARKEAREKAEAAAAAAATAVTSGEKKPNNSSQKEPGKGKGKRRYDDFDTCMDLDVHNEESLEEVSEEPSNDSKTLEHAQDAHKEDHSKPHAESGKQQNADHGKGKQRGGNRGRQVASGPGLLGIDFNSMTEEERREAMDMLRARISESRKEEEEKRLHQEKIRAEKRAKEQENVEITKKEELKTTKHSWEDDLDSDSSFEIDNSKTKASSKTKTKVTHTQKIAEINRQQEIDYHAKLRADKIQENLRSPICAILGHVDTGKTSLLDKIRSTNIQGKEVGGITQQIGSTFFSYEYLSERTKEFPMKVKYKIPGLLIVDTPGHESFANLRSRGSSLADIAILVVDLMHGLERQTIESINLLKARNCPFIVALNKIDRLYNWKSIQGRSSKRALEGTMGSGPEMTSAGVAKDNPCKQEKATLDDFEKKYIEVQKQFAELEMDVDLWWNITDLKKVIPVVPTSAFTEEGIPDLLAVLVGFTQLLMEDKISVHYSDSGDEEMQCTVLELRKEDGFGYTIDCILVNGELHRGDTIVLAGLNGPIVTKIRELLTPQEAHEIREKGTANYKRNDKLRASIGFKIYAMDLETAIPGSTVLREDPGDNIEDLKECVMADIHDIAQQFKFSHVGVYLNASSLGSMEALITYLSSEKTKVPLAGCSIGPISKNTVQEAALQLERTNPEYACILAFDIEVDKATEDFAKINKVKIFRADIIYHLYDMFVEHLKQYKLNKREELKSETVFPCIMTILDCFHHKDPLIIGVRIDKGFLQPQQPICFPTGKLLGKVESIQKDNKSHPTAKVGAEVAIRIETADSSTTYGRTFSKEDTPTLYTAMNRKSIDILKKYYRDELTKEDWTCVKAIKTSLNIDSA